MDAGLFHREVAPFWKAIMGLVVGALSISTLAFAAGTSQVRKVTPRVVALEAARDSIQAELDAGQLRDSLVVSRLDRILCYLEAEQQNHTSIGCAR